MHDDVATATSAAAAAAVAAGGGALGGGVAAVAETGGAAAAALAPASIAVLARSAHQLRAFEVEISQLLEMACGA